MQTLAEILFLKSDQPFVSLLARVCTLLALTACGNISPRWDHLPVKVQALNPGPDARAASQVNDALGFRAIRIVDREARNVQVKTHWVTYGDLGKSGARADLRIVWPRITQARIRISEGYSVEYYTRTMAHELVHILGYQAHDEGNLMAKNSCLDCPPEIDLFSGDFVDFLRDLYHNGDW